MFRHQAALAWCLRLHLVEVMSCNPVDNFLRLLKKSPPGAVFNPWWQVDEQNDIGRHAPAIRRRQLRAYLRKRLGKAKLASANPHVLVFGESGLTDIHWVIVGDRKSVV